MKTNIKSKGFTLSEVLITLGVIGVVAAITMPIIITKIQDRIFYNQKKKAQSEFTQVFERIRLNEEFVENSNLDNIYKNFQAIQNQFKVVKACENSLEEGCWIDTCGYNISEEAGSNCYAISLEEYQAGVKQGGSIGFVDSAGRQWVHYKERGPALWILVDVNGDKGPNLLKKDRFFIRTYKSKIGNNYQDLKIPNFIVFD